MKETEEITVTVPVNIYGTTKGQTFFIPFSSESKTVSVQHFGGTEMLCGEDGNGDYSSFSEIKSVGVPPWFDVDGDFMNRSQKEGRIDREVITIGVVVISVAYLLEFTITNSIAYDLPTVIDICCVH
jgi:hypothetical protein